MLIESLSGVRGIFSESFTLDIAKRYASAYMAFLLKKNKGNIKIVIGMDTRPSGPQIKETMIPFLTADIIDVGILPTPAIEHAVRHFDADGGIIITASHNEPFHNGFKFLGKSGAVLNEKEMEVIIALAQKMDGKNIKLLLSTHGENLSQRSILQKRSEAIDAYERFIFSIIGKGSLDRIRTSHFRIILDPNGGAGTIAKHILESAGVSVIGLNMTPGNFAHRVEPTQETLYYLSALIQREKAHFGAGFDCDADRVEIVLPTGRMVSGNELIALASEYILSRSPDPKKEVIVVNNATSSLVREVAHSFGATLKEVEVGESNVIESMIKEKSRIGGEGSSSGVIIAPQTCRDGILGLLLILAIISRSGKSLPSILDSLPKYTYLKEKVEINRKNSASIEKKIATFYKKKGMKVKIVKNGSIKVLLEKNTFIWFRQSKTEDGVFRIIADSPSEKTAGEAMKEALELLKK